jgi:hypothetical protein
MALVVVSATSSNGTRINADKETRISVNLRPSHNQVAETKTKALLIKLGRRPPYYV